MLAPASRRRAQSRRSATLHSHRPRRLLVTIVLLFNLMVLTAQGATITVSAGDSIQVRAFLPLYCLSSSMLRQGKQMTSYFTAAISMLQLRQPPLGGAPDQCTHSSRNAAACVPTPSTPRSCVGSTILSLNILGALPQRSF